MEINVLIEDFLGGVEAGGDVASVLEYEPSDQVMVKLGDMAVGRKNFAVSLLEDNYEC